MTSSEVSGSAGASTYNGTAGSALQGGYGGGGAGGAGIRAAIEAHNLGAKVLVVSKGDYPSGCVTAIAMGAISCFFPVALITAAGMRQIDQVLIRVGRSFRASTWQMVTKIYFPALRHPLLNGLRLGFGVSVIGVLLAETKLSNRGLGFMVMQSYSQFDMPGMYALLLVVFSLAIMVNSLVSQLGGLEVPNH